MKKFNLLYTMVLAATMFASTAHAEKCIIDTYKEDGKDYSYILMQTSSGAYRAPKHIEVMRMMTRNPESFQALKKVNTFLETDDGGRVTYWFNTFPKEGVSDPACKDRTITGYECRSRQIQNPSGNFRISKGSEAPFWMEVTNNKRDDLIALGRALKCLPATGPIDGYEAPPATPAPTPAEIDVRTRSAVPMTSDAGTAVMIPAARSTSSN